MGRRANPTRRVRAGNGHVYWLDGVKLTGRGVTTLISNGVPKNALQYWAARTVAEAAVHERDVWEPIAAKSERGAIEYLKEAPFSDRDTAAKRGTDVHRFAEQLADGQDIEVPDELAGHVDNYLALFEEFGIEPLYVEAVVINRRRRYMGTLDLIAVLHNWPRSDWPEPDRPPTVLLDIKTARSGVFPENALQLAGYRYAESFLEHFDGAGEELPMVPVDRCAVAWIRADGYDVVPIDAGPDAFATFLYAAQVAHWAKNVGPTQVLPAIAPEPPDPKEPTS